MDDGWLFVERQSVEVGFNFPGFAGRLGLPGSSDGVSQNGKVGRT
jgi:hypothetical protein